MPKQKNKKEESDKESESDTSDSGPEDVSTNQSIV